MKVLAIDPGSAQTGWILWCSDHRRIEGHGIDENTLLLDKISNRGLLGEDLVSEPWPEDAICVIEDVKVHTLTTQDGHVYVPGEADQTQRYIGRLQDRWSTTFRTEPEMLARSKVISHLKANKRVLHVNGKKVKAPTRDSQVMSAMKRIVGEKGTKANPGPTYGIKSHEWQALALAITFVDLKNPF